MVKGKENLHNIEDLAIREFKLGCKSLLDDLKSFHTTKKRLIEHCFQKLLDNVPNEIINAPYNECIEEFFEKVNSKEFEELNSNKKVENNKDLVVDQSICDSTISTATSAVKANITALEDELLYYNNKI